MQNKELRYLKFLKKGPLDADKSIAQTLDGQIVLILDTSNDSRVQYPKKA